VHLVYRFIRHDHSLANLQFDRRQLIPNEGKVIR